jgi:hypothetical protein
VKCPHQTPRRYYQASKAFHTAPKPKPPSANRGMNCSEAQRWNGFLARQLSLLRRILFILTARRAVAPRRLAALEFVRHVHCRSVHGVSDRDGALPDCPSIPLRSFQTSAKTTPTRCLHSVGSEKDLRAPSTPLAPVARQFMKNAGMIALSLEVPAGPRAFQIEQPKRTTDM